MESTQAKINLLDFDREGLEGFFESISEKPFRAVQLMKWIHQQGVTDFDVMTNLSKDLRSRLTELTEITPPRVVQSQVSRDGTRKWLLSVESPKSPANGIEMVFIPEDHRGTLCISSQVGCSLDCSFCATARQGFNRNLSTAEIIGQVWLARRLLTEAGIAPDAITNIVLMGMGEPLLNFNNVLPALRLMLDDNAYGLSKRRVTLSTAGVVPAIDKLRQESDVSLAISLHAPNDELRDKLVPLNKKFPLAELLDACRRYLEGSQARRRITFEYVMLQEINDRPEHARQLARVLQGIPSKINLIPFNPFKNADYTRSTDADIERFGAILLEQGYVATIRKTRGEDIDAACGQLVGQVQDRSRRHLKFVEPRLGAHSS
ncbi:MAG TPA: 23S rRNA (adenine(2503)-C(2))-methyltransferase RlmN [Gammaproteobacteria bacterium]